jgi:ribosomal protein S1
MNDNSIKQISNLNLNTTTMVVEKKQVVKNNYGKILKNKFEEYNEEELNFLNELLGSGKAFDYSKPLNIGDVIEARVGGETATHYLFDIDGKDYIHVEKKKQEMEALYRYVNEGSRSIEADTLVKVQITNIMETPYHFITGSLSVLEKALAMNEFIEDETPVLGKVISASPAGVVVEIANGSSKSTAFCPSFACGLNRLTTEQVLAMNGNSYYFVVDSYSEEQGTYSVSRKLYLQQLIPQAISKLETRDKDGKYITLTGIITGSSPYGIFVELENSTEGEENILTGMIHNSTLNDHYKDLLSKSAVVPGTQIEFFVKEIVDNKLVLAQVIKETLWDTIKVGDIFNDVTVSGVKNIGYLVDIDGTTKGLINPNESSKVSKPIIAGDKLNVKVVSVNRNIRKIFLSII